MFEQGEPFTGEFPPAGIMREGEFFEAPRWVHPQRVWRTPTARDWIGLSAESWRTREVGDNTPTLPDQLGFVPRPEWVEWLMGFPEGWTRGDGDGQ